MQYHRSRARAPPSVRRSQEGFDVYLSDKVLAVFVQRSSLMKVMYINNDGGGFADYIDVTPGTTVGALFDQRMEGKASDYLIRVNRQPTTADYELQEGDRISFTPVKIEGA